MKKRMIKILILAICIACLSGCSSKENLKEDVSVKVSMPDGLPSIALSKLAFENKNIKDGYNVNYNIEKTPDNLSTTVMKGEADIAVVPSNMAAIAYNKTKNYEIAGTTGLGSFYLVSNDDIGGFKDLKGKEVVNTGKGLTPDITNKFIIKSNGLNEKDINFTYVNSANELVPMIVSKKANTAIVPEPALTALKIKNPEIKVVKSLNEEYKNITKSDYGYPQATIIVKSDFAKNNKEFVNLFLEGVKESIIFVNSNPDKAGEYCEKIGVGTKKEVINKSIENANLQFIGVEESIKDYKGYYKILSEYDVKSIGGKIPDEKVFYKK
ncbi:ABC transporter nitrate/sulfonate/taurine extracellular solute-binding protein [[Clostridium] sordellii]|uniref:ABC-type transport system,nitrate/sulfonate/taurine extracellular solute-binding protein n=1 Tax=Paraclostridium sordellii TaxID=1505 RepID=A0ABM9RTC2_PARSO|nr:ABC transporter substrate-binding protein [Paeniclostridium sordellii]TAN68294.1 ABC transporter substrate-binding protein [Paeniclostridium sordellii 8483]CEJ75336.1 ABC-type transport system,nitrate/sulfonate/taurine extracellular solute-binding protein [[Clostridium] sordellii] [Paeniclostridium sordellii]CEK29331.1 ABC transporter nitrate/sulfonate/taurine extracellular solute-binding protein [[Clostridium] sordellii] [Paeniclostridium sordellii]CEN71203.1 ABC transporter nitrate/sulfona